MAEVATATFDDTSLTDFSPYLMDVSLNQSRATEYDTTYDPTGVSRFEQGRIAITAGRHHLGLRQVPGRRTPGHRPAPGGPC